LSVDQNIQCGFAFMTNEFLLKEFGDRIKQLRLEKNLSQEKLSFATGFRIGMIEIGERNAVSCAWETLKHYILKNP